MYLGLKISDFWSGFLNENLEYYLQCTFFLFLNTKFRRYLKSQKDLYILKEKTKKSSILKIEEWGKHSTYHNDLSSSTNAVWLAGCMHKCRRFFRFSIVLFFPCTLILVNFKKAFFTLFFKILRKYRHYFESWMGTILCPPFIATGD